MAIMLISHNNAESYSLPHEPAVLIKDGKEFYVTDSGVMFPAESFTYVFNWSTDKLFDVGRSNRTNL